MPRKRAPRCVVVAGPNGAGKTTAAPDLVSGLHEIGRYVNADTIAAGLAGFSPGVADHRAGRIALDTIAGYIAHRQDFAFETTLSGRRWPRLLASLGAAGYSTHLHYLWLPTADLAVARVRSRVARGGHHVPERDVRRRYDASLRNLRELWLTRADKWQILDASQLPDLPWIAAGEREVLRRIADSAAWATIIGARRVREVHGVRGDKLGSSPETVAAAASRGVRRALAIHRALGVAAATWRDGRVVIVPPEELPELASDPLSPESAWRARR